MDTRAAAPTPAPVCLAEASQWDPTVNAVSRVTGAILSMAAGVSPANATVRPPNATRKRESATAPPKDLQETTARNVMLPIITTGIQLIKDPVTVSINLIKLWLIDKPRVRKIGAYNGTVDIHIYLTRDSY